MRQFGRLLLASFIRWLPLATLAILVAVTIYATVQQSYRSNANDPQIQMATDARTALENGAAPRNLVPATQIDIARSYAPYLAIYDTNGKLLASSATLHGQPIIPPSGVFTSAKSMPWDAVTWMPENGVRSAIIVVPYAGGYVLAGRSLTLVEDRESSLELIVGGALLATLAATFVAMVVSQWIGHRLVPTAMS